MREELTVFVVDPHAIFRRGVAECLRPLSLVTAFAEAATVEQARADVAFAVTGLFLVDPRLDDAGELIRDAVGSGTPVIACVTDLGDVAAAQGTGAVGFLHKASLTPEMLRAGVQAAAAGLAIVAPELLGTVGPAARPGAAATARGTRASGPGLTAREQRVLTLLADGHATREVAARLSYSERTVKNVLHDAVTKLGARSRSEAIAQAVREGLI
jgi:DNA-binding NarL/FixJ family response regulator